MKNYYEILEIEPTASFREIRSAYRRLSKKYHPDLNLGDREVEDYFKDIQEAYSFLKDGLRREEFDEQLALQGIHKSKIKILANRIKNKLSVRKTPEWVDEEDDDNEYSFRPVFQNSSKNYYKGLAAIVILALAVSIIFFLENRYGNETYQNETLSFDTESQNNEQLDLAEKLKTPEDPGLKAYFPASKPAKAEAPAVNKKIEKIAENTPDKSPKKPTVILEPEKEPETTEAVSKPKESPTKERPELAEAPAPIAKKNSKSDPDKVFMDVERKPRFSGGATAFVDYLNTNLSYPPSAREDGISGRVLVTFIVEKDGRLTNISVAKGIGGGCDEEAVRVMKNAPSWLPGENNGEKVRVQCTIPITFKLQ